MPVFPDSRQLAPARLDTGKGTGDTVNDSKKQLNPEATTEILSLINSDDPGCERGYNPALCRMRHTVARLKEARGMRHEYEPCAYCPKFIAPVEENTPTAIPPEPQKPVEQHQATPEKPKEAEKMKKTHKCKCGEPITAVRAKSSGKCKTCYHKDYNATYKRNTDQSENAPPPAPKTGAGFQEMPGVGEYIPEPAANTIHASPAPRPNRNPHCHICGAIGTPEQLTRTSKGWICPTCAGKFDKPVIHIEESDVCRRAILQYGMSRQIIKAAEEFAEAAAVINRHLALEASVDEIAGELADVEIMCVQMRLILGDDVIDAVRAEKVARLHGRLKP